MAESSDEIVAGVVGLGMIGGGVATSLARRGRVPVVYDVRPAAADLPGDPELAESPADLARRADVVLVAVVTADQAREVICGDNGLLAAARPGLTVVLLSTVERAVTTEFASACAGRGVGFLDCGVTPGDRAAENGMVAMVGGDDETVAAARPVLDDFAKSVVHCGPVGAGMATKIARNIVTYGSWRAVAEAAELAEAADVDPATLMRVITTADPDGQTLLMLLNLQSAGSDSGAVGRQIEPLMTKDLNAAQQLARDVGVEVPLVDVAFSRARRTLGLDNAPQTTEEKTQ